jgi:hypothetical protein
MGPRIGLDMVAEETISTYGMNLTSPVESCMEYKAGLNMMAEVKYLYSSKGFEVLAAVLIFRP